MNVVLTGTEPRYTHDCERCKFLGSCDDYDVWTCSNGVRITDSMIARKGSEGSDYFSMPRAIFANVVAESIEKERPLLPWAGAILRVLLLAGEGK